MNIIDISFENIAGLNDDNAHSLADKVVIYEDTMIRHEPFKNEAMSPVRINALAFFVCIQGEATLTIDYRSYQLKKGVLLSLHNRHIMENISRSNDYKGYAILISPNLLSLIANEIPNKGSLITKMPVSKPLTTLEEDDINILTEEIVRIKKKLQASSHYYQNEIIKNEVSTFIFELTNIFLKRSKIENDIEVNGKNHKEEVMKRFIQLLLNHGREQHEVSFYAEQLNMTAGNLTRIMKSVSGRSPIKWIGNALVSEAKILLRKPDTNIQLVSEELNFADQSSFGKFFKKHTGATPMEYRGNLNL